MDEAQVPPTEPPRLSIRLERADDRVRIVSAPRQWGVAGFLLFWLTGWTIGCLALAGMVIAKFSLFTVLFAIPFWAAEIFVFCLVGTMIASREVVLLDQTGVNYLWTVWRWPVTRRQVPLSEIVGFSRTFQAASDNDGNHNFSPKGHRLALQTVSQNLSLPGGASEAEVQSLEQLLNETLETIKRYYAPQDRQGAAIPTPHQLPAVLELRPPSTTEVPPPSDTTWRYHFDFDAITFRQRGRLALGALGMLLFFNAFWNGCTGVFVAGLWGFMPDQKLAKGGGEWWLMFFFLIPFQLIGLVMFVGLITVLLEPLRFSRWRLLRNAITIRLSYLGIGRTWTYEIRELDRLELRKEGADEDDDSDTDDKDAANIEAANNESSSVDPKPSPVVERVVEKRDEKGAAPMPASSGETRFDLAFVDRAGSDVCEMKGLSLGEACWIADVVLRERAGWFR